MFIVDLKTFLSLAMLNSCCHAVTQEICVWVVGGFLGKNPQTFMISIYSTTILCGHLTIKSVMAMV